MKTTVDLFGAFLYSFSCGARMVPRRVERKPAMATVKKSATKKAPAFKAAPAFVVSAPAAPALAVPAAVKSAVSSARTGAFVLAIGVAAGIMFASYVLRPTPAAQATPAPAAAMINLVIDHAAITAAVKAGFPAAPAPVAAPVAAPAPAPIVIVERRNKKGAVSYHVAR
jgi:hypothetical protein